MRRGYAPTHTGRLLQDKHLAMLGVCATYAPGTFWATHENSRQLSDASKQTWLYTGFIFLSKECCANS